MSERLRPNRRGYAAGAFILLFLAVCGMAFVGWACVFDGPAAGRFLLLGMGGFCLYLPVWVAFQLVRRKVRTGRWWMSDEERLEQRRKWLAKQPTWATRLMEWGWLELLLAVVFLAMGVESMYNTFVQHGGAERRFGFALIYLLVGVSNLRNFVHRRRAVKAS